MPTALGPGIPTLRIFSEEKAREFYVDFLGFTINWEHRFEENAPIYMEVHRDDLVLRLSEHVGDGVPGAVVFVNATGIDEWQEELLAKKYKYLRPHIELAEWGARVMTLIDPNGNKLCIAERVVKD